MQIKTTHPTKTQAVVTVVATEAELNIIKQQTLKSFQGRVSVPGFRKGHVPPAVIEKNVDSSALQSEFLEEAIEQLYPQAIYDQKLRPVERPKLSISKFVPFTNLEFVATVSVVSDIKIADYKKLKLKKPVIKLSEKEVNEVLESVRKQLAEKVDVDRAVKVGDEAYIDFSGVDEKGKPINGADGSNYPLAIGSNQFIPGFEDNIVGMKAGDEKTFELKFPKDYGVKALASKKVVFTVNLIKVQEVKLPALDDDLAVKTGQFKTLQDLKDDIRKQAGLEKQQQSDRQYESDLIKKITDDSSLEIPDVMIDSEVDRIVQQEKQNAMYRGQTWQEYLEANDSDEDKLRSEVRSGATERVKASLVLAEIAEIEKLDVTSEELELRLQLMRGQYKDAQAQEQLSKPEVKQDIASRLLTEKVIDKLVDIAS